MGHKLTFKRYMRICKECDKFYYTTSQKSKKCGECANLTRFKNKYQKTMIDEYNNVFY